MMSGSDTESLGSDLRGVVSEGDSQVEEGSQAITHTASQDRTTPLGHQPWVAEPRWGGFEGNVLQKRRGDLSRSSSKKHGGQR